MVVLCEENRELNKQLIKDIDYDRSVGTGKQRSFKHNASSWQSQPEMEKKYDSFKILTDQIENILLMLEEGPKV